jgi:type I restriction enzyme S subunit
MSKWQQTTLGKVLHAGGGKIQTGPFGSQLHASDYVALGIPCIMPTNMINNRVNLSEIAFISEKDAQRLSQHLVQEGDIVYSRRGDVTQKALIGKPESGYFCGTGCLLVRPGSAIDPKFLTYHLSTPTNQNWIVKQAVGATMPNLNTAILSAVPLNVPPHKDQQRIAAVLSDLDAKIDCNNRINAELEAMAKTLYDYWFVQFNFPDANGKPYRTAGGKMTYNPTLKREIPVGWSNAVVADILDKPPSSTKIPNQDILDVGTIPVIDQSQSYICGFTDEESSLITPKQSHVVFGDHTRAVKLVNFSYARGADGTQILVSKDLRMPGYLLHQVISNIDLSSYGYARHYKFLKESKIILPSQDIAQKYQAVVTPWLEKTRGSIFENLELARLRDWLLPLLMNGQVTVA